MTAEGSIRVTCLPWKINRYVRFHVFVDDVDEGLLRAGKSMEIPVQSGEHRVAIETAGLGTLDLTTEVPAGGAVALVCAASLAGLTSAARSSYTEVWDGPLPMNLWKIDDGHWPEEPRPERQNWWTIPFIRQEALAYSPILFWRLYYRVGIKHYVAFGLVASVWFSLFLFGTLSQPHPSALWTLFLSVLVVGSLAVVLFRALARRQMSASPVNVSSPDT